MFQIFGKKRFLVDYLGNFVDIHNHILPGIDDGAKSVEDSLKLLKAFAELGITNFVATPHIMHNYYPNTSESISEALGSLKNELLAQDLTDIAIEAAAEHMIDDNFEAILAEGGVMPIRKEYLLVEMSYLQPSINFKDAIIQTANKGYFPILAHPERYNFIKVNSRKYGTYKKHGIQFQLNMLSLGNYYEPQVQKKAIKLLEEGMIDYLASDAHSMKHMKALKEITVSQRVLRKILPVINKTIENFY